ncbi:MAG: 16S rRNA (guanine527-N7)-methyltransferase [Planctomycetota bacterium]
MIHASDLTELATGIGCEIPQDRAELLLAYLDAMLEENLNVNLTAVRDRETAVIFHALDSLAMGNKAFGLRPHNCLDLGSGNGFPGIAIACLFPNAKVLLMDRTLKKLKAIERAVESAGFQPGQISTTQMNASEAPAHGYRRSFDLVTVRAVGPAREMGILAKPLLPKGGSLLCWLSSDTEVAAALPGDLRKKGDLQYSLPSPGERTRRLVSYQR